MKNREKFLLIFMITTIILTILTVIKGNIEIKDIMNESELFWCEFNNGEVSGKHSDEIEEGIKQHIIGDYSERDMAVQSYLETVMMDYNFKIQNISPRIDEIIHLIFCSLSITLFIYFMITIEYKNKKQYLLTNIYVFGILLALKFICNLLFFNDYTYLGTPILFYNNGVYYVQELLLVLYLMFLTGNAIKNKRKLQLFNAIILDLVVIGNAIYSTINWYLDITWDLVFGIYLILLAIEGIIILVRNLINKKQKNKEIHENEGGQTIES